MSGALKLDFAPFGRPAKQCSRCVLRGGPEIRRGRPQGAGADRRPGRARGRRRPVQGQERHGARPRRAGRARRCLAPCGRGGVGKARDLKSQDFVKLGGVAMGQDSRFGDGGDHHRRPRRARKPERAADLALGHAAARLYVRPLQDQAQGRRRAPGGSARSRSRSMPCAAVRKAYAARDAVADGVMLARDLVNEPANVLYPEEFARRTEALKKLGVAVEVLDVAAMKKLGMNALLGVGQGSEHESRCVIMRWNGGKSDAEPVAFIGKGVCFDTGGISIKPAAGMEDMKGDMAGAACVVGLMQALAARKAKVNAVGAIGIVENMPRRQGAASRRHRHDHVRTDDRDHQHRRRRPARARRRAALRQGALQAEIHDRSRDADRRHHRRARPRICRPVRQRRPARRAAAQGRAGDRREGLAHAARAGIRQEDRIRSSPT